MCIRDRLNYEVFLKNPSFLKKDYTYCADYAKINKNIFAVSYTHLDVYKRQELGYLHAPDNVLIDIEEINKYPPEKVVLITTGSQGEPLSLIHISLSPWC